MKPEEPILFKLIKSLDKNEKGYFRKQATPYGKTQGQNYLHLFDAIDKLTTYDEQLLKKQFAKNLGASGFSQAKAYLLENLLKNLSNYYHGNLPSDKVNQLLQAGIALFNKNMDAEAAQYLSKAKTLAYKIEDFSLVLDIVKWEKMILGLNVNDRFLEDINALLKEEQTCTKLISDIAELQKVYYAVYYCIKKERNLSNEAQLLSLNELMASPILQQDSYMHTSKGQIAFHNIYLFYYDLTGNYEKGYYHSNQILKSWQGNPPQAGEGLSKYLSSLQNHMNYCWRMGRADEVLTLLEPIKALKPKTDLLKVRVFEVYNQIELTYYAVSLKLEAYEPRMKAFIEELEVMKAKVRPSFYWVSTYNLCGFYLFLGRFEQALEQVNKLLPSKDDYEMLQDSKRVILITNLIVHYELGNWEALPHYIRATERALKQQNSGELELSFMRFMKKLLSVSITDRKEVLMEYLNETKQLESEAGDIGAITKMFDWKLWLQSQIQKKTILAIMRAGDN